MNTGLVFAIVGSVIGVIGGVIGTYAGIARAKGRDRTWLIWFAVAAWLAVGALVGGLLLIPQPYSHALWIVYAALLMLGIWMLNRKGIP